MRHISPQLCAQLSCISLLLIVVSTSYGQTTIAPNRIGQDTASREQALTNLRIKANTSDRDVEREKRILLFTLKEDFRQLQIVELALMKRVFPHSPNNVEPISQQEIRDCLSEIQNRARRLKTNLRLPEAKTERDTKESLASNTTLSAGLLILDQVVVSFVDNPIFQQPLVLDAQMSVRAAGDLNKILGLTDSLRKLARQDKKE